MLAASIMWGAMSPISKYVMSAGIVGSIVVTDVRIFGAALLFWLFSMFTGSEKVDRKDFPKLFAAAMFAIVLNQGVFITGVSMTSPVDASIFTTSLPIVTMILAAFFLKEPITPKKAFGVLLGMSGALLLVFGNRLLPGASAAASSSGGSSIAGDLLCLLAECSYAIYLVLFKGLITKYSPVTLMKWMFTFSAAVMFPFTIKRFAAVSWESVPFEQFAGLGFILFCGTFLCYQLVPIGQKTLRPTLVAMYNYVQPVVAALVAVIWGMDSFNLIKLAAVALVFAGVLLVNGSKSRADVEKELAGKTASGAVRG